MKGMAVMSSLRGALRAAAFVALASSALLLFSAAAPARTPAAPAAEPFPASHLSLMKWRSVGPANMGGRVSSIAVHPKAPWTIYVGLGTGGVMKSSDNGVSWGGVFEKEAVASIGAIAIAPSDPNVVWVGTGEANGRNSSSWGNGVYRSTDGGGAWTNVGLGDSFSIARIVVHPSDPATAWVAAMGHLWGPSKERGVFRTTDAGKTWTPSLQIDDTTGCIDLVMDPSDPRVLYAAMYHRMRHPWSFVSGGPSGGIYKTTDGGRSWSKLANGLPPETGRIGLDVHRADPRILYAVIESDAGGGASIDDFRSRAGGIFRSDDSGATWHRVNQLAPRAFYFSQIRVDPKDPQRVYVLGYLVHVSDDGGRTFRDDGAKSVHVDHHDLWIDPDDTNRLLLGNDGGVYASYNRAGSWDFFNNMAVGEFYRIALDMSTPYRIAGGLQDNSNWLGTAATMSPEGIGPGDWRSLGGGDGFSVVFDPVDRDVVYAESQGGEAFRLNLRTGQRRPIQPLPKEGSPAFRFHWNSPLVLSPHEPATLWLGGNRVFRLTERGDRWQAISPDLSVADPARIMTVGSGAENHGTVYTLAESPRQKGLLWAGTDDGRLWLTEDAHAPSPRWSEVTAALAKADRRAAGLWVSRIEASHHDPDVAYVAVDGHTSDLFAPLVFMTADRGRTWRSISGDLPPAGPVKVVREDVRNPDLLFAGTEFGVFMSLDRGGHWTRAGAGLPTVAVDDIAIHPREMDLVIGTHGRSIWVLDDIRPLQEMTAEVRQKEFHLFTVRPRPLFQALPEGARWSPRIFKGDNPPSGLLVSWYNRQYTGEEVSIKITDAAGRTVRTISAASAPGINRTVWDLAPDKDPLWDFPTASGQPRVVAPGEYTISVSSGNRTETQKVQITADDSWVPE